jgi:hypothetical protein
MTKLKTDQIVNIKCGKYYYIHKAFFKENNLHHLEKYYKNGGIPSSGQFILVATGKRLNARDTMYVMFEINSNRVYIFDPKNLVVE